MIDEVEAVTTDRYQIVRRVGSGGMGVVYEAEDRERGQKVALKTINDPDIEKVYQLKREFRALADLSHPNLVALYDLVVADEACFFTMELLDGDDLLAYVARAAAPHLGEQSTVHVPEPSSQRDTERDPIDPDAGDPVSVDGPTQDSAEAETTCDIPKLRATLPQLVQGLVALHGNGKIHRDVKPSNIRVTSDGRVVLLDFGLVAELERTRNSDEGMIVGTIAYMAPEQCAGELGLTPAVDWYALGVVLFQCLTGRLPYEGPAARVILEKQTKNAPRPSKYARGIPRDLEELCCELLDREPSGRPNGRALLARLTGERQTLPSLSYQSGFTGREAELAQLGHALETITNKRASVAVVRAPSGMGKSALIQRFFERVRATHENALLLRGRCLDREDIPYKAIDDLIDDLSEWWREQTPRDAQAILPRDASMLPTLFPVLGRVPAIADAPRTRGVLDPQARRTLAFEALREALQRLSDRRTVVLFLDDMQWVDRDTTTLLADVMRAPDPPPLLLVLATRADDSEKVIELVKRMDAEHTQIDLGPLSGEAAIALAKSQLASDSDTDVIDRLVAEAAGSPLFLIELTRYLQSRPLADIAGKGLDAMLLERITSLGEAARVMAELVAISGEPITRRVLATASGLPSAELTKQLSTLRGQRVLRASGSRNDDTIEPYHDRIREAVIGELSLERRAKYHRTLAIAMAGQGSASQLARHWYGAGEIDNAAPHARKAGDEARNKLDFDMSARWYAIALESNAWADEDRRTLRTQFADALHDAGRPREAAEQFKLAAEGADAASRLELHRRASGALLQSGYVTEGMELTHVVLSGVGLAMPKSPTRALMSMLWRRAWLRIRGLGFSSRSVTDMSQAELTRVDVCEGVSFGLALVNTFLSMDFGARFLMSALRLGEPWRVSRALALETDFLAVTAKSRRTLQLLGRLEQMTPELEAPQAESQLLTTKGLVDFFIHNRFRTALTTLTDAITKYRAVVGRMGFELDTVTLFVCWSLYYAGELGELSKQVPAMAEAAVRNGNRYTAVTLRCAFPSAWLARMDPDEIEGELDAAVASWTTPDATFQLQDLFALCSRVDLALYRGEPERATQRIADAIGPMRRSLIDRPPMYQVLLGSTFGRHALACAAAAPEGSARRKEALAQAKRYAKKLRKRTVPLMRSASLMLDGGIAELEGRDDLAMAAYRAASDGMEASEASLFGHAIRMRLGRLVGGDEGERLRNTTHAWLIDQGARDPETMISMLLPGRR
ncbi:MAG: protein kinase [Kofleriaceae bacterium]